MGKTAIVTGGSRGIGRAVCIALARQGLNVVINYSSGNPEAALETKDLCGDKAEIMAADVSDFEQSEQLIKFAVEKFGGLDVLVNNAGITRDGLMMRMSEEDFDRVINVNLKGSFNCIRHASKVLTKQRSGSIVNITSVVGLMGNAGQVNYCSSKAGVIGLTKAAARELAARGVTVNAVAPGFIDTDMTRTLKEEIKQEMLKNIPLKTFGTPEDIANTVCFLVSDAARYITGQVISVNGGMYM